MTLIVENGTGKADAESYASVAQADARASALGISAWAALDTSAKEAALRKATDYMVQAYRSRWAGRRLSAAQALDWPRYNMAVDGFAVASDSVPSTIVSACIDLAFRAATTELAPDLERPVKREKIGALETEYADYGRETTSYRAVDLALEPFFNGRASCIIELAR